MTTISSAGVGSGLNIESIVTALMSVEKQPLNNLEKRQNTYESKISALGTLKGALSSLQTAAKALTPAGAQSATAAFSGFKATLADSTIATATTTSAAVAGTYSVDVGALATNQRLALGKTYDAGAAVLDFGTDTSRTLTLTSANDFTPFIADGFARPAGVATRVVRHFPVTHGQRRRVTDRSASAGGYGDISCVLTRRGSPFSTSSAEPTLITRRRQREASARSERREIDMMRGP